MTELRQVAPERFQAFGRSGALDCREVFGRWRGDPGFRDSFLETLASSPFEAFRWETPAVTSATANRPFEFVLVEAPELLVAADPAPFAEHFVDDGLGIATFDNLGGDATLVVPSPRGGDSSYGHLSAFVREAPREQVHALWSQVGKLVLERLSDGPLWLSTAGGGVAWLHVRLDTRPKYYTHAPYRRAPSDAPGC